MNLIPALTRGWVVCWAFGAWVTTWLCRLLIYKLLDRSRATEFNEHGVIVYTEFLMHLPNWLWQLRNKLCWSSPIDGIGWNHCIRWQDGAIQYLYIIVDLGSMAYDTVFADLNIVPNLERAYDAIFFNVDVVSNAHFGVLQSISRFCIARPYNTFFTDDNKETHFNRSQISS